MKILAQSNTFKSRNAEIRSAEKIMHVIKSDFPANSPFIADCIVDRYLHTNAVGAKEPIITSSEDLEKIKQNYTDLVLK